ncbi:hypothetical protein RsTz2092_10180 [Deferribacterales bacterium RsTz2092]|nr:hypothetical protein AGMMS49941_08210 [Deferribacterales bacterium]
MPVEMMKAYKVPASVKPLDYFCNEISKFDSPRTIVVVPTARNRDILVGMKAWELSVQTIKDFRADVAVHNGVVLPKELRAYYLYQAAKSDGLSSTDLTCLMKSGASKTMENYIAFVQRSDALLPFYRELCEERVDFDRLALVSLYDDYGEQIQVLEKLWKLYLDKIHTLGYVDAQECCYLETPVYGEYINRFDKYIFLISGFLTNFEFQQLKSLKDVVLYFNYIGSSHPQAEQLMKHFDISIETADDETVAHYPPVNIAPCKSRLAQFDYITREVRRLHNVEKVPYEDIAVVVTDKQMNDLFVFSDRYKLFRLSEGRALSTYSFFELLECLLQLITESVRYKDKLHIRELEMVLVHGVFGSQTDLEQLDRDKQEGRLAVSASGYKNIYELIKPFITPQLTFIDAIDRLKTLLNRIENNFQTESKAMKQAVQELDSARLYYSKIEDELSTIDVVRYIVGTLRSVVVRTKNVKGKVIVMGLLESRNMDYKYLFLPDMSSDVFPTGQDKDLFMNTGLRRELGLPTFADRQELRKGYLYQLISRAEQIYVTYTDSEETLPSPFIDELLAKTAVEAGRGAKKRVYNPAKYIVLPTAHNRWNVVVDKSVRLGLAEKRNFKYSPTSINTLKMCELKFFYQYIGGLSGKAELVEDARADKLGSCMHKTFERLHNHKPPIPPSEDNLRRLFNEEIKKLDYFASNPVGRYEAAATLELFTDIATANEAHLREYWQVVEVEAKRSINIAGVKISGRVDRIDHNSRTGGYAIIDYKYKNADKLEKEAVSEFDDKADLQLPIYALMLKGEGKQVEKMDWFALQRGARLVSAYGDAEYKYSLNDYLNKFKESLTGFIESWLQADAPLQRAKDENVCRYCPYELFCTGEGDSDE